MLALDGLVKSFPGFRLGPIDLRVAEEVLAVLGPSGCGKTTLLSAVAGIAPPDRGTIRLDGRRLDGRPPDERGAVLLFQEGALFPHMTARENVAFAAERPGLVDELAATLEVTDVLDRRPEALSGGQRRRVALARALAADPSVLLLDEPFANLDAPIRRRLRDELGDFLAGLDVPVVYVTHDQRDASVVGDRIAVMEDGTIHQVGPPAEVFERPASPFVASFTGNTNVFRGRVVDAGTPATVAWHGHRLEVPAAPVADDVEFCIRPERVRVVPGADADPPANAMEGAVARRRFAGDTYRLSVRPDGAPRAVTVALSPAAYDRLDLDDRDRVRVALPREDIHVLDGTDGA